MPDRSWGCLPPNTSPAFLQRLRQSACVCSPLPKTKLIRSPDLYTTAATVRPSASSLFSSSLASAALQSSCAAATYLVPPSSTAACAKSCGAKNSYNLAVCAFNRSFSSVTSSCSFLSPCGTPSGFMESRRPACQTYSFLRRASSSAQRPHKNSTLIPSLCLSKRLIRIRPIIPVRNGCVPQQVQISPSATVTILSVPVSFSFFLRITSADSSVCGK